MAEASPPIAFTPLNDLERDALAFAAQAHAALGQRRKHTDQPYIVHPVAVAELVRTVPHTTEMVAAALLHDVVEDTEVGLDAIRERFGEAVAELVDWLTDISRPNDGNRRARRRKDLEHLARAPATAQTVKFADLIDNSRSISRHDPGFWPVYRREMLDLLAALTRGDPALRQRAYEAAGGSLRGSGDRHSATQSNHREVRTHGDHGR
jgi:(p)ppGpp synthase/HD superfamily hydrolase